MTDGSSRQPAFAGLGDRPQTAELIRSLLDSAPDAIVVVDAHGRIVLVNLQAERVFAWSREELIGREIELLIPDRLRSEHVGYRSRFTHSPKLRPMGSGLELFGRKRDGTEFPVEISLSPLSTEDGMLISASVRDITERKQNEIKVRRIQAHLLSAVESIQGAFAIFDAEDRLVLCNSTCRILLGRCVPGEIVGRSFEHLVDANLAAGTFDLAGRDPAGFRAAWLAYHRAPGGALDARTSDGHSLRIVERPTAEAGTVVTIWDVTDEVEHEEQLRGARAIAEAASSAKSEFLASMSHELRTPLNSILGFAQLLQRDRKTPLSARQQERVEHVLKGGEHLLRLIDEVLDLSRIEAGRVSVSPEPVAILEVLSEVKSTLHSMAARAEIELVIDYVETDLPMAIADRTRLKQILMNYGSNAIKYGRKRGSARFRATAVGSVVRITVSDDGIGVPQDKHDRMFQPFQRLGQETGPIEGTGIGLAITKRLAELMSGTVGFESEEGRGSQFWIELPVHRASASTPAPGLRDTSQVSALAGAEGPRYVVVYIEDNPSNIAFMEDLLADFERVELLVAPTAEIGIELVRARQPNIVIMDINLPGMNGIEATQKLRTFPETRNIPVIALSAAAMVRDAKRVQEAGFYRFLTKPVKVDELARTLEELLTAGASASHD
jgi:PAS domain S-box-containing protein